MLDIYSLKQLPLDIKKPHLTNLINIQIPKCFKIINDIFFLSNWINMYVKIVFYFVMHHTFKFNKITLFQAVIPNMGHCNLSYTCIKSFKT